MDLPPAVPFVKLHAEFFRNLLGQPSLGTGERAFEIDRLESIDPIFDRGAVGLGGFLLRAQDWLTNVSRVELEPRLPRSVNSLLATDLHDVGSVTIDDLGGVFADTRGFQLREIGCRMGEGGYPLVRTDAAFCSP